MADLLVDIQSYLISKSLVTVDDCWLDTMPSQPDSCVGVYEYTGVGGPPQADVYLRSIQIVTRDRGAQAAKTKAQALHKALQSSSGIVNITPTRPCTVILRQTPFKVKVDDVGRTYYGFNIGITTYSD